MLPVIVTRRSLLYWTLLRAGWLPVFGRTIQGVASQEYVELTTEVRHG